MFIKGLTVPTCCRWLMLAAAALLLGCAQTAVTVRESHVAPIESPSQQNNKAGDNGLRKTMKAKNEKSSAPSLSSCELHVATLTDARSEPTILGYVAGRPVYAPGEGSQWIEGMLRTGLAHEGIAYSHGAEVGNAERMVQANVTLVKAWVSSLSVSKTSSMVLSVSYSGTDEKIYRGSQAIGNWSSGEEEIQRMVDATFQNLLVQLSKDVKERCSR